MKIRIKGNSLRYRLTKSDIANLANHGYLNEQIDFAGQSLIYSLKSTLDSKLSAEYKSSAITLFMPKEMIKELVETNKVGFSETSGTIYLLIEKDFTCMDNVVEDQSDNYPNPLAQEALSDEL